MQARIYQAGNSNVSILSGTVAGRNQGRPLKASRASSVSRLARLALCPHPTETRQKRRRCPSEQQDPRHKPVKSVGGTPQNTRTSDGNPSKASEVPLRTAGPPTETRQKCRRYLSSLLSVSRKRSLFLGSAHQFLAPKLLQEPLPGLALHASTPCRLFLTRQRRKVSEQKRRGCKELNSYLFWIETLHRVNIPNNKPNNKLSDNPEQTFACNLIHQTAVSSPFLYIFVSYFNRISNGKEISCRNHAG